MLPTPAPPGPISMLLFKSYLFFKAQESHFLMKSLWSISAHIDWALFCAQRVSIGCWNCQWPEQLLSPLTLSTDHVVYTLNIVSSTRLGASFLVSLPCWHSSWHIVVDTIIKRKETVAWSLPAVLDQGFGIFPVHVVLNIALVNRNG